MDSRTLEITLHSGTGFKKVNYFHKMDVYAVVSISGGKKGSNQAKRTTVHHGGDANPKWISYMKFTVEEAALQKNRLTLHFKLVSKRKLGDKNIGEVSVPVKGLLDSPVTAKDGNRSSSYPVQQPSGNLKGKLSFSWKFDPAPKSPPPPPPPPPPPSPPPPPPGFGSNVQNAIGEGLEMGKNLLAHALEAKNKIWSALGWRQEKKERFRHNAQVFKAGNHNNMFQGV